ARPPSGNAWWHARCSSAVPSVGNFRFRFPRGGRDVWGGDVGGGNLGSRNPGEGAGWPCASSRGQPAPFAGTAPGLRLRRERRGRRAWDGEAAQPRRPGGEFRVYHGGGAGDSEARGRARASV